MVHRDEIDGLRALAVLPVIFFHAGFTSFAGGYVGVDVFFVISGYLITGIIWAEREKGIFSLRRFYERRAKRILPALITVILVVTPISWLMLQPFERQEFAKSVIAVMLFASNFLFWKDTGYFESASELKPLLHTWSLGVEEQYYLFFPLVLAVMWRLGRQKILALFAAGALASLILAHFLTLKSPSTSFFLLPTRAWEFLLGGIASQVRLSPTSRYGKALSWMGLTAIVVAIFVPAPVPSLLTLLPVLGTCAILCASSSTTGAGYILSWTPIRWIGLVSYSAYLWHQPIVAFVLISNKEYIPTWAGACIVFSTFILAYITWRFVEVPFRRSSKKPISGQQSWVTLRWAAVGSFAMILLGGGVYAGTDLSMSPEQRRLMSFSTFDSEAVYREKTCLLLPDQLSTEFSSNCAAEGSSQIFLWGDSHGAALSYGLRQLGLPVSQFTASSCPPILDQISSYRADCPNSNTFVLEKIAELKPSIVLLHANWWSSLARDQLDPVKLAKTIREIRAASASSEVVVIGGLPQWHPTLPRKLSSMGLALSGVMSVDTDVQDIREADGLVGQAAAQEGAQFVSALDLVCRSSGCQAVVGPPSDLEPLVWDYGHLTKQGSIWLAQQVVASIKCIENAQHFCPQIAGALAPAHN